MEQRRDTYDIKPVCPEVDPVNHPSHYGGEHNIYEVVKVTEAWEKSVDVGGQELSHNLCSAIEYIARCNRKGTKDIDLNKAIWRIQREIESMAPPQPFSIPQ